MKLKKYSYLIAIVLMLLIGINNVKATSTSDAITDAAMDEIRDDIKTCYYIANDKQAMAKLQLYEGTDSVYFNKLGKRIDNDHENILNWDGHFEDDVTGMMLPSLFIDERNTCPEYLIMRTDNDYSSYGAFATNSLMTADSFVRKSNATGEYKAWYLTYKDASGNPYTSKEYFSEFVTMAPDEIYDEDATITCDQLFGDKNDDGELNDVNRDGTASIAYMVNAVLQYVRIIVPILIIILGTIDLSKAVISSKEDEIRKAQSTFIKRLLLGLVVFFVPLIVDVIMDLADIVWEASGYSSCEFR